MLSTLQIGLTWAGKSAGGADRVFADLAASLPQENIRFIGAVTGPPNLADITQGVIHSFATEEESTFARLAGARANITKLIRGERPDIVASHFAPYTIPLLDKISSLPLVIHFHGPWGLESREEGANRGVVWMKHSVERAVYRRAQRFVVLSRAFAALLSEEFGIDEKKIRIVPGAVDLDRFQPQPSRRIAREILHLPQDRPILLSVRRLVNRMGLNQLFDAVGILSRYLPEVLLCVGGSGPLRRVLEAKARVLGIENNIRFLGFVPDESLPVAFRAADISVVPTLALEGFGLVAAESLAAGTPVMVTPIGGLPEVVRGLSESLIFESGKPEHMAAHLRAALSGELALPDEDSCRKHALQQFSRSLMAARTAAVYREL